jgi:hypothetical protein
MKTVLFSVILSALVVIALSAPKTVKPATTKVRSAGITTKASLTAEAKKPEVTLPNGKPFPKTVIVEGVHPETYVRDPKADPNSSTNVYRRVQRIAVQPMAGSALRTGGLPRPVGLAVPIGSRPIGPIHRRPRHPQVNRLPPASREQLSGQQDG